MNYSERLLKCIWVAVPYADSNARKKPGKLFEGPFTPEKIDKSSEKEEAAKRELILKDRSKGN